MTFQEFQKQEMALQEEIADLRMQTFQMEADIASTNRHITKLEWQRTQLRAQYAASNMEKE